MTSRRPPYRTVRPAHRRAGLSRRSRNRLLGVLAAFAVFFALITYKLVSIQGADPTSLQQVTAADEQRLYPPGVRGSILASNGDELALSEMRPTIFADPYEIRQADAANGPKAARSDFAATNAAALAPLLHQSVASLTAQMSEPTTYVVLAFDVSSSVSSKVGDLALPGVGSEQLPVRYNPDGSLASPLLGQVDSAGLGYSGLEEKYNSVLTGTPGKIVRYVDLQGQPVPGDIVDTPAVNGRDVLTTINEALQYQTEQALAKGIAAAHAVGGTAMIMDRRTGELLAVASMQADGKKVVEADSAQAFTYVYEPGSVSKIVTISSALADGLITPTTRFDIPDSLQVADRVFNDAETHPDEILTPTGILAQSSNIGAIQVAERLGPTRLFDYLKAYGLTTASPVGFPGESSGQIPSVADFSGTTLATLAFGQGYDVTAAQMLAAINTVANGGMYVAPRLVTATVGADGRETAVAHEPDRRVIPASVASEVTSMLEQVVSSGTGTAAAVAPYAVAGKTGTAYAYKQGYGYLTDHYVSSFAGFTPAQDPAITAMVVIDNTAKFGAAAAAPVFATITRDALQDLSIPSAGRQPAVSESAWPIIDGQVVDPNTGVAVGPAPAGPIPPPAQG